MTEISLRQAPYEYLQGSPLGCERCRSRTAEQSKGLVFFPPNPENLDIVDSLMVLPRLGQMTSMDAVPLASIERITRQAGKRVLLHGDFGSRHITFTDKLKRDECLHLLMKGSGRRGTLMQELERASSETNSSLAQGGCI